MSANENQVDRGAAPTATKPGDPAGADAPPGAAVMDHRQIMLVIYGLMAGMFLSSLGQTVFGTAIRTIGDDLNGLDQQAWVTTAYLITSTISTPVYGKLSDVFGRRPLYIFGITVFILGSLLSAFSTSMLMLAGFRAITGIGAGALMSLPLAIMGDILAPRDRAKYQGFFLGIFGISAVIGPLIGGLFAGADEILWITGWRWVLLVNVPIGLVALAMVVAFLHLPKLHHGPRPHIDWWGAALVVVTLVPWLLVAEQGRVWGWGSGLSIACYVIGAVGLAAFLVVETRMGSDAIIPLRLFRIGTFSMATVLGFLVGFAMFGVMLTLPMYLQISIGLDPTQSGFATLPLMLGLMIASIGSGQIISRTGNYRIFPPIGSAFTAIGYFILTFIAVDTPLWFVMIGMFVIGLGLGQLMQTLTLASQSAVEPEDMGVATSSSTFFRQIGGTLGVAVLLSVLFAVLPSNIVTATADETDLSSALDAALDPSVAGAPENAAVMAQVWDPIVGPVKDGVQQQLDGGAQQVQDAVTAKVTDAVQQQVAAGAVPAAAAPQLIGQQVDAALPGALDAAAVEAHATVVDGRLEVDWSDAEARAFYVAKLAPDLSASIRDAADAEDSGASTSASDTSFLTGADPRLTRPFKVGFDASTVTVYWIGFGVILLAFVLTLFFRPPPLRQRSALQERADGMNAAKLLEEEAADGAGHPAAAEAVRASTAADAQRRDAASRPGE